ncbi:MAG: peptidase caspase catalytic subunit p20 [Betaproteobacteria bacterium]|nr:peptidase caspase catalytic subunit p20 [Betaproteobacteria bacterium]
MQDHQRSRLEQARRRWLKQAGLLASSATLPFWIPDASAQSDSALSTLPRTALVIGNTNYSQSPLRNPVNDAKAIGGELQKLGFKVDLLLDASRAQMASSIQAFGGTLGKTKGVGLFYYAGHGAQLAWRNYLIPVDADVQKLEDMRDKTVELNSVLQGLVKAANPMNVIILDACRDNPFGNKVPIEQKGLSQFDAPPGSLLAYATSPGNTAADGEGQNGLYTENLLRELNAPAAKIEDVFKRVRLAVRRRSEGRQIPWESTSLEEDFYFQPLKQVVKLSEADVEKQFEEELAGWDKIKDSRDAAPIEEYLRKYPSGKFFELANFRLTRLLAKREIAVQVAAVGGPLKPASGGAADFVYQPTRVQ